MGVVNITPDSFSDGGNYFAPQKATQRCLDLFEMGADVVDLGAESSRPGADGLDFETEWLRLGPVLEKLSELQLCQRVSIDTRHDTTMLKALQYNVGWINNIEGIAKEGTMLQLAKKKDLKYVAMHMHRSPTTMQAEPLLGLNAVEEVTRKLKHYHSKLTNMGFAHDRIYLDPGIGFGKDDSANLQLLKLSAQLSKEFQMLVGVSRKSFIGRALKIENPIDRDGPSKMLELGLAINGIQAIRTHQVDVLSSLLSSANL